MKRFVIVGDNHGDTAEEGLPEKFFEWLGDFRPQIRIHSGDNWNFAALRKKATQEEKTIAIAPDYEAGNDFIDRYFDGGELRVLLRGNHDERIYDLAETCTDAALKHLADKMTHEIGNRVAKRRVRMLKYDAKLGVLDVDGVRVLHGYAAGIGSARKFAFVYGTCAFGHTHSMDVCPVERWPRPSISHGTGCIQKIDQPYNSKQIGKLRHENGWLYGFTDGTSATYFQAKYDNTSKVIHVAENFKAY
jgi:predicted phosphodiesterase